VEGDAHAGRFIQHRFLAKKMPVLPNNRQVHLMPSELFGNCRTHGPSDTVRADRSLTEGNETSHDHEARTANVQVWRARCCKGDRANRARRSHNC
jgi:hypothetical protein